MVATLGEVEMKSGLMWAGAPSLADGAPPDQVVRRGRLRGRLSCSWPVTVSPIGKQCRLPKRVRRARFTEL